MNYPDWETPWRTGLLGRFRNILGEFRLFLNRASQRGNLPRLVILPSGFESRNPASLLRAYEVGRAMQKLRNWRVTLVSPKFSLKQRQRIIAGEKPEIVARNDMQEEMLGSPAIADGAIYLRGVQHLWKIGG